MERQGRGKRFTFFVFVTLASAASPSSFFTFFVALFFFGTSSLSSQHSSASIVFFDGWIGGKKGQGEKKKKENEYYSPLYLSPHSALVLLYLFPIMLLACLAKQSHVLVLHFLVI